MTLSLLSRAELRMCGLFKLSKAPPECQVDDQTASSTLKDLRRSTVKKRKRKNALNTETH